MRTAVAIWLALAAVPAGAVTDSNSMFFQEVFSATSFVSIQGTGDNDTDWRSAPQPIEAGKTYQLMFGTRSIDGGGGGTATSGPLFCNRDLGEPGPGGRQYSSVFVAPSHLAPEDARIKFGQWYRKGALEFHSIFFAPCQPVYARSGSIELGAGENVSGSAYEYRGPQGGESGNQARVLAEHDCPFNTNRWTFRPGSYVMYRHGIGDRRLIAATLSVGVTYHVSGTLSVEVSTNGTSWRKLGELTGVTARAFPVPSELVPARALFVRLSAKPAPAEHPTEFQVASYAFRAIFTGPACTLAGQTRYGLVEGNSDDLSVSIERLGDQLPGGNNQIRLAVKTPHGHESPIRVDIQAMRAELGKRMAEKSVVELPRGHHSVDIPYTVAGAGWHKVFINVSIPDSAHVRSAQVHVDVNFVVPTLYDDQFGALLPASTTETGLWWCTSGWKVSEARRLPSTSAEAVSLSAARGETEAAQLVIRPATPMSGFTAVAGELAGPGGARIPAGAIDLLQVRYVPVTEPSDETGGVGRWPDPLPPLTGPLRLAAGKNQPIWVRVRVPRGIAPGTYIGEIRLAADRWKAAVPLHVEVFDFDLPEKMTLDTSFGFEPRLAFQYHGARDDAERRTLLELYYANLAAHHIAPFAYDTAPMDPFVTTWTHTADGQGPTPAIEWTAWDREMARLLETYQFGSFAFPVPGMYGGDGDDRPLLAGFREGSTGYSAAFSRWCALAQAHLQEKGWLDRAYVYWYDEPQDKAMPFVMNGMRRLKQYLPGVRRMITEEPRPELNGGVDLWCPILDAWDPAKVAERRKLGEKFWWYICTGPKAPFVGEFIDRQSADLRVWCWQSWDQAVEGILIWATDYWTTASAYPESGPPQNPYEDPMSWQREAPPGVKSGWGNGDGRLIYPPLAGATGRPGRFISAGPVDSMRWEHLRDGIEDYEYLAVLQRKVAAEGGSLPSWRQSELAELLKVPEELSKSLTDWTKNDQMILDRRAEIARAIEHIRGHPAH